MKLTVSMELADCSISVTDFGIIIKFSKLFKPFLTLSLVKLLYNIYGSVTLVESIYAIPHLNHKFPKGH